MIRPVIFLGPSLGRAEAESILAASYRAPAQQGDVYRAVRDGARLIGIIDGHFREVRSVWHKEILWALNGGATVLGAASMGALRAAELGAFGMQGVGDIFAAFCDGRLTGDDEVAVEHGPAELGYPALSEALVNIRATLAAAEQAGVIPADLRRELERSGKAICYPERSWGALLATEGRAGLSSRSLKRLEAWLVTWRVNQKRLDALALLRAVQRHLEGSAAPRVPGPAFEPTELWARFMAQTDTHL